MDKAEQHSTYNAFARCWVRDDCPPLTLPGLGGGSNRPAHAKLRMFRQENEKKSEKEGRKNPSPSPTTPPTPRDFIVYTLSTHTTLVESTNRLFSCILFIHACKSEKNSKKPSLSRVKVTDVFKLKVHFKLKGIFKSKSASIKRCL